MNVSKCGNTNPGKAYSGKDVLDFAKRMMAREMEKMKGKPLTAQETEKLDRVASSLSFEVLREMKVV